jgi:hypothetical protein
VPPAGSATFFFCPEVPDQILELMPNRCPAELAQEVVDVL